MSLLIEINRGDGTINKKTAWQFLFLILLYFDFVVILEECIYKFYILILKFCYILYLQIYKYTDMKISKTLI